MPPVGARLARSPLYGVSHQTTAGAAEQYELRRALWPAAPGSLRLDVQSIDDALDAAHALRSGDHLVDVLLRFRVTLQGHDRMIVDGHFDRERFFRNRFEDLPANVRLHRFRIDR